MASIGATVVASNGATALASTLAKARGSSAKVEEGGAHYLNLMNLMQKMMGLMVEELEMMTVEVMKLAFQQGMECVTQIDHDYSYWTDQMISPPPYIFDFLPLAMMKKYNPNEENL